MTLILCRYKIALKGKVFVFLASFHNLDIHLVKRLINKVGLFTIASLVLPFFSSSDQTIVLPEDFCCLFICIFN